MSRKPQKKDAREQSTRQLMGIDDITDYGIATRMGELVFFAIKPTNISVLPDTGVGARIYALLNVVKGMAEIEMLVLITLLTGMMVLILRYLTSSLRSGR